MIPDGEFEDQFDSFVFGDIEKIRLDCESALSIKQRVLTNPRTCFLLYLPDEVPHPESDWLLDLRLWDHPFSADRASMLLNDLGLAKSVATYTFERTEKIPGQQRKGREV